MSWIANIPYGPLPIIRWTCDCGERGEGLTFADGDEIRAAAIAHLEATGHVVTVDRGTRETIYPMATTVPGGSP